jgi:hypothetical protein
MLQRTRHRDQSEADLTDERATGTGSAVSETAHMLAGDHQWSSRMQSVSMHATTLPRVAETPQSAPTRLTCTPLPVDPIFGGRTSNRVFRVQKATSMLASLSGSSCDSPDQSSLSILVLKPTDLMQIMSDILHDLELELALPNRNQLGLSMPVAECTSVPP